MGRFTVSRAGATIALAAALACAAPPPEHPAAVRLAPRRAAPPTLAADVDRAENPYPQWIAADWADADRATRSKLVAYAKSADAWTERCDEGFAATEHDARAIAADVERELRAIPAGGSPYEAFDAFHEVEVHFRQARDRMERARSLGSWEASFFLQPVEQEIRAALLAWEARSSSLLVSAAGTTPLGASMPVAVEGSAAVDALADGQAVYCRWSRDHGTQSAPRFAVPSELRALVRLPFEVEPTKRPPPVTPPALPSAWSVDGVVQSVAASGSETRVTFTRTWKMMESRPPCHVERCTGIDCGMVPGGPMRTICKDVEITRRATFVAIFAALPRGLVLRKGDAVSFRAAEELTLAPPYRTLLHAVVLDFVDRPSGDARVRLFSLTPP